MASLVLVYFYMECFVVCMFPFIASTFYHVVIYKEQCMKLKKGSGSDIFVIRCI